MEVYTLNDLNGKSLVELKQLAKARRFKHQYVKTRIELIRLLTKETSEADRVAKLTLKQLREEAKGKGMTGFWSFNRQKMVELLYPDLSGTNDNNQDDKGGEKEKAPENGNAEKVGV